MYKACGKSMKHTNFFADFYQRHVAFCKFSRGKPITYIRYLFYIRLVDFLATLETICLSLQLSLFTSGFLFVNDRTDFTCC
jgi:hypothetical protein